MFIFCHRCSPVAQPTKHRRWQQYLRRTTVINVPISLQPPRSTRSSSVVTLARPSTRSTLKSLIALSDMHHLVSGINFLTLFVSLDLIYLLLLHHFFLITSAYQFQHHHCLLPSPLHFFILASKPFFSINPTLHTPLVPFGLISRITSLFIGFLCSTVLLFSVFFQFQFSKSFSSSDIF